MTENQKKAILGIGIYAVIITLLYYFRVGGENYFSFVSNLIMFTTPVIPIYFGYKAVSHFGLKSTQGKSSFFILLAIFMWWIGDIIFSTIAKNAVISAADLFYLVGYALFGIGILYGLLVISKDFFLAWRGPMLLLFTTAAIAFIYLKFLPIGWDNRISFLENMTTTGYVVADLVLVIGVLLIAYYIFLTHKGLYSRTWIAIGCGILLIVIGDISYALNYNNYVNGDLVDILGYYAFLLIALGFFLLSHNADLLINSVMQKKHKNMR